MSEINHRYLKDNDGNRYFPVTHVDAVRGIDGLVKTTGWQPAKPLNGAKTKEGYSEPFVKHDTIFDVEQVTIKFYLENISDGKDILEIPSEYVGNFSHIFSPVSTVSQFPNKVEIKPNGKVQFFLHDENTWNKNLYAYLEATWQL